MNLSGGGGVPPTDIPLPPLIHLVPSKCVPVFVSVCAFVHVLACVINAEPFHKSFKLPE